MKNKKFVIVGAVVFILLLVGAGIIFLVVKKDSKSDNTYGNEDYTECVNEANALTEANEKIADQIDADIKKCTRDYLIAKGYTDNEWCVGTDNNTPTCSQDYDPNKTSEENNRAIYRYNAEIEGDEKCSEDREERLETAGYKDDIVPAIDCMKYLGK